MEVHAHTHTERKKFTHYLWEFLMLFLAVFCGFLAENQREHMVDHQREKQYMITMLEDLRADIPLLDSTVNEWNQVNKSIDSVTDAITPGLINVNFKKIYRHINEALNYWSFKYNDRTISQLKNSGGFRLIRNKTVANKIISYDQFNNNEMANISLQHEKFYENATAIRSKIFAEEIIGSIYKLYGNDPASVSIGPWIDSLMKVNKIPLTGEGQSTLLFQFKNSLLAYERDYDLGLNWGYKNIRKRMIELISLIQKEYSLK